MGLAGALVVDKAISLIRLVSTPGPENRGWASLQTIAAMVNPMAAITRGAPTCAHAFACGLKVKFKISCPMRRGKFCPRQSAYKRFADLLCVRA
jgi:hypothetical protein